LTAGSGGAVIDQRHKSILEKGTVKTFQVIIEHRIFEPFCGSPDAISILWIERKGWAMYLWAVPCAWYVDTFDDT
jgi:hypothetical protein